MYDRLVKICEKNNVTIRKVCTDTGISPSTISNCKSRGNKFNVKTLNKLSEYFSVPIDYFFGIDADENAERYSELVVKIGKLNDANLALLESMVDTMLLNQE